MIKYIKDTDDIVTLVLDMDNRPNNIINHESTHIFQPVVKHLQEERKKNALKGVILTSAKKAFLAGGDLEYLRQLQNPESIFTFIQQLKQVFRDLEQPGIPVVAAINGNALDLGFELALACHHRIVLNNPSLRVGLPGINMGLIPGTGGIVRLMWLLGIKDAYEVLTSGRKYQPQEALHVGIIDELAKNEKDMMEKAKKWLLSDQAHGCRPWDEENGQIPKGTADTPVIAEQLQLMATQLAQSPHDAYFTHKAILNILSEGSKVDFNTASLIESRYYTQVIGEAANKNMISTFWFDFNAVKNGLQRPKGYGKFRPKKVGVVGAGLMGSGIAFDCARRGMQVVLKDVSKLVAEKGITYAKERIDERIRKGKLQSADKDIILSRIQTADKPQDFADCDIVIEAVFENENVKKKVTKESDLFLDEYAIFGTNTISIPITELSKASARPENYVGLHFFYPVDEVPLVEIVSGDKTSDETIARAYDFVRAIKKMPIIVKDDWGFYAARVKNTYILEGITMLQEGYPPALVENISRQAGMPSGALAMADDLSLELVMKYEQQAAEHYGPKYKPHPAVVVLQKMQALDRTKKQGGFYEINTGRDKTLWSGLAENFPHTKTSYDRQELEERFLFVQVIEAVWCLQEGVIQSIPEANIGSVFGWGFPRFKGGVIQYIKDYGVQDFLVRCKAFEQKYGQRFKAPSWIRKNMLH